MNKPIHPPVADDDIGPLDEHGQQVWSAEEVADAERRYRDPAYLAEIEQGLTDIRAGRVLSHEAHRAAMIEGKRRWLADRAG